MTRRWRILLLGTAALMVLTEIGIRQAGLVDFPLYDRSAQFGYIPRANQSGSFMRTRHWVFNDHHMGVASDWRPGSNTDLLLIGNSIVMGGNPYDQDDKLGPLLQQRLGPGCPVWPLGAGGWSTVNEVDFLATRPELVEGTDFFIWEYMPGQMTGRVNWHRHTTHPTERPLWATAYYVRKALHERFPARTARDPAPEQAGLAAHRQAYEAMLGRLAVAARRQPAGLVFLYPDRLQLAQSRGGEEWIDERKWLEGLARNHGLVLVDVARDGRWTDTMYRDNVHPTAEGNRVLADILADAVEGMPRLLNCGQQP